MEHPDLIPGKKSRHVPIMKKLLVAQLRACGKPGVARDIKVANTTYGPTAVNGVKYMQRLHDLPQDGVVGPKTWKALERTTATVLIGKWITGDKDCDFELMYRLSLIGRAKGKQIFIRSGRRSRQEQEILYQKYLDGRGPLAARPGTSPHESGNAADCQIHGVNIGNADARGLMRRFGLCLPVPGETWHVQIGNNWQA